MQFRILMTLMPVMLAAAESTSSAVQDDDKVSVKLISLAILLLVFGVGGIIIISMLFTAWRRYNKRMAALGKKKKRIVPDMWQAGGDRLVSKIEQKQRAEEGFTLDEKENDPDGPGESDEEDDGDEPVGW